MVSHYRRPVAVLLVVAMLALGLGSVAVAADTPAAAQFDPRTTKAARSLAAPASAGLSLQVATDGDDDTVATAIPFEGAVAGSLSSTDRIDIFSVVLTEGDRLGITITGDGALNADVHLFAPGITDPTAQPALTATIGDEFEKSFVYVVETTGTHYLVVTPVSGAGEYLLTGYSAPWTADPDNDIPGVTLPASPFSGTLDEQTDPDDVYAVELGAGDRLSVQVSPAAALDADVYLYDPETDSILTGVPVAGSAGAGAGGVETFLFDLPGAAAAADYYLDVRAASGSGGYNVAWSVASYPVDTWDNVGDAASLTLAPRTKSLDVTNNANDLYSIDLSRGDRLTLDLAGAPGTDYDLYVYGPNATDIYAVLPVAWSDDAISTERLVFDCAAAGIYYVEVRAFSGSGQYTLTAALGDTPVFTGSDRLSGADRYETAIKASAETFAPKSVQTVVIATGQDFPDALSASALAGAYHAPILLTRTAALPAGLLAEIDRLGATKVDIVGGTSVVSPAVETALKQAGLTVYRVAGSNRYQTSAAVARRIQTVMGKRSALTAFVVNGENYADATAVSPYAYSQVFPVLLTQPKALSGDTAAVAAEIGVTHAVIAGGTSVVSADVAARLDAVPGVQTVHREGGANRYETTTKIAQYAVGMFWASNEQVGIATGADFPDALGGGAVIGSQGGVLLMTQPTVLAPPTAAYLGTAKADVVDVSIFGGAKAVSDAVKSAITSALAG